MCQNKDRTEASEKQITDRAGGTQGQSMECLPRCRRKGRRQEAPLNPGLSPFFVQDGGPRRAPRAACDNHGPTCGPLVLGWARARSTELTAVLSKDHSLLGAGGLTPTASCRQHPASSSASGTHPHPHPRQGLPKGRSPRGSVGHAGSSPALGSRTPCLLVPQ